MSLDTQAKAVRPLVGRHEELASLAAWLDAPGPRVAFVHGMGGIGKTSLIRTFAAAHPERRFVWHDADALPADLSQVAAEAADAVVVIDGLEHSPGLAETLRRLVLPTLSPDATLILGSRPPPEVRWKAELGAERFLELSLEGLDRQASKALLAHQGAEEDTREALLDLCHGHPLMLVLAAQLSDVEGFVREGLEASPELVVALVEALGAAPRDAMLTDAVLVSAIARRTTEPLLREVLELDDARELFDTLRRQSWMLIGRDGLYPHDLVRDALRANAKWRDRPTYDRRFRAVATVAVDQVRQRGKEAVPDLVFLLADNPFYRRIAAHRQGVAPGPATPTDFATAAAILEPHVGASTVAHMRAWHDAGALSTYLVHGPDGEPSEAVTVLDSAVLRSDDPTEDPVVVEARELLRRLDLRPGARVVFSRGAANRDHGLKSPLGNARILVVALRMALDGPAPAALGSVVHPPEFWRPMLERARGLTVYREVTDGDRTFLVQFQDLRVMDVAGWLETQLYPPEAEVSSEVVVLDRDEFDLAVREALKALTRPDVLVDCRLCRAPLVFRAAEDPSPESRVAAVESLLLDAVERVADERVSAVLRRTYVDPAPKQYAAAVELGLTFSTYRRALAAGVASVSDTLWAQEVAME